MIKNRFLLIIFSLFLVIETATADEKLDLQNHFLNKIDNIISIVEDKTLNRELRNNKIISVLTPMFDFKLMAKLSLGKKWKTLDKDTQKEFVKLYVKRMKQSYSSKVDKYTDEKIVINSLEYQVNKRSKKVSHTRALLNTSLVSKDDKMELVYKFYKPKKQIENKNIWLTYDVVIDGVSIIKTDKAQFKAVIRESSIEGLIKKLRK